MIAKEDGKADGEHNGDKKEEEDVETRAVGQVLRPEPNEMRESDGGDENTVHQSVEQEEQEELVGGKCDAVVHPGTLQK